MRCNNCVTMKLDQPSEKTQAFKFSVTEFIFFILQRLLPIGEGFVIF
jgi:hypothetical protein